MSPSPERSRVVIVGGGVGGLACALDLTFRGHPVALFDRSDAVGGKLRALSVAGRRIDAGPTVMTMRWVFDELLAAGGTRLDEHVTLRPLEILARHNWPDGSRLDLHADPERSTEAIREFAGDREADGFTRFRSYAARLYETVEAPFIRSSRPHVSDIGRALGWRGLRDFMRVDWHRSMWTALGDFFTDPRLRQLFGRYATYYGSSPFLCPATLNLIAHVEQQGVWRIEGGMVRLAEAMERLLRERGATLYLGRRVDSVEVEGGRVRAVHSDGERISSDAVVINAAPSALRAGLFGPSLRAAVPARAAGPRSLSAVTWAVVAATRGFPLDHHNVFFSNDSRAEFDDLFTAGRVPADPTVYVCAQDRGAVGSPSASERLLVLVNAPARGDEAGVVDDAVLDALGERTFAALARAGLEIEFAASDQRRTGPREFEGLFPSTGGALYGGATHSAMTPFSRPAARTNLRGLYLAGGGAHPGAGIPMVALSGRIAAAAVVEDRG